MTTFVISYLSPKNSAVGLAWELFFYFNISSASCDSVWVVDRDIAYGCVFNPKRTGDNPPSPRAGTRF